MLGANDIDFSEESLARFAKIREQENNKTIKRANTLENLLSEFGLQLNGFDPGVLASRDNHSLSFDGYMWAWLEPLLIELRDRRNK